MIFEIVVIGGSSGGFSVLKEVMAFLPQSFRIPAAVVLHRAPDSRIDEDINIVNEGKEFQLTEIKDKDRITPGTFYIAPPDYHLLIDKGYFSLSLEAPVNNLRPSIDVLFDSASAVYGGRVIGLLLSGWGKDGTAGLNSIKKAGGITIVQSPETAQADEMPRSAIFIGAGQYILPPDKISELLVKLAGQK